MNTKIRVTAKEEQKLYMNTATGSVDTIEGWYPFDENNGLIEVEKNDKNEWQEVKL